ncbi:MAG: hypothetical protein ACR2NI_11725, partial [Pirellulales bacterium]
MAADNTRKTSNIIHTVDGIKSDVNNLSQNIENNTESIGNIKVYDSHIWLSTSKGLTVTQNGNTTTNNDQPTEWKLEADTNYLNTTLGFAKPDDIPSVYVKDIQSGDITTLQVTNDGKGTYTLTATGGGGSGGGGFENITLAEGTCIDITNEPYDDNGTEKTKITVSADTDCLNTTLNFARPTDIGNGNITLAQGTGISVTGSNATANQKGNSGWAVALNASLDDLNNVSTGTPSDNQVLTWDGSNWTSQNASGGTFKTINGTNPDASGNFNIINGTGINATAGTNNLTLECTVQNTDTGILTLTDGTSTVPESGRSVEFTSSDASVQYTLTGNKIDLTVPAAGLNIKGSVQYAEPQTEADGIYTDGNGEAHEVLWLPSQYLEAASGVDSPALGDLWIIQYEGSAADGPPPGTSPYGHGYVFSLKGDNSGDYEWVDAGRLQGPPGEDGTDISLEENVTVNSNSTISSSTGEFVENASTPGEYALTLNIAPSDVNADGVKSLNGLDEAINITSSDSFLKISNNDSVNPKTIDLTLKSVTDGGQNLALKTDIKDGQINMTASNGVKMSTGSANATANQATNTEFKIEANYTEIAGNISVGNLSNVCDTAPSDKQVLSWDATANSNEGQWCPANATAAAALPISDNRDPVTVTLDSPSASTFAISTGNPSVKRFEVQDNGTVVVEASARLCGTEWNTTGNAINEIFAVKNLKSYADNGVVNYIRTDDTNAGNLYWYDVNLTPDQKTNASVGAGGFTINTLKTLGLTGDGINFASNATGDAATVVWEMKNDGGLVGAAGGYIQTPSVSGIAANDASLELGTDAEIRAGTSYYKVYSSGYHVFQCDGSQSRFTNDGRFLVNTATTDTGYLSTFLQDKSGETGLMRLVTQDDANGTCSLWIDCIPETNTAKLETTNNLQLVGTSSSVELGANVTVSTGAFYLDVGNPAKNITIGDNTSGVAGGDGVYILSRTNDIAFSSNEIRFNSDWSGGATEPTWVMTEDSGFVGNNNFNYIKCGSISGTISDDASIQLGANFAVSTNGQATLKQNDGSAYTATSSDSLMTKKNVEDILTGSGGNDGGQLPGSGSNYIWQKVQIWQPSSRDGEDQPVESYRLIFGCDGIFTDGVHWTLDGENWNTADSSTRNGLFDDIAFGDRVVKSYAENLYWCDNYFSYDMKNWNMSGFTGFRPFYLDGHLFEGYGDFYFDPTGPSRVGTSALYGKSPILPSGITQLNQYLFASAGEPTGSVALRVGYDASKGQNVLLQLKKDEIGNADWGWNHVDLPGDDEPFNVLFADGNGSKFYVFCAQKVYVSSTADSTNFESYALPAASGWDLVCYDGVSITAASSTSDLSIFSRDHGETWNTSNNFQNNNGGANRQAIAGTNGRTIYSYSTGSVTDTDEDTGVVTDYTVYQYLRSGVGGIGDETLIIGGGSLAQTGSIYLAEPIDTAQNNQASGFPTWRTAPPDYN